MKKKIILSERDLKADTFDWYYQKAVDLLLNSKMHVHEVMEKMMEEYAAELTDDDFDMIKERLINDFF